MSSSAPGRRGRNPNGRGSSSSARGNKTAGSNNGPNQRIRGSNSSRRNGSSRQKQQRPEDSMSDEVSNRSRAILDSRERCRFVSKLTLICLNLLVSLSNYCTRTSLLPSCLS